MINRHDCVIRSYAIPGFTWSRELCWLYDTVSASTIHAEVGVYCGRSLFASCGGGHNQTIYSIDNDSGSLEKEWTQSVRASTFAMLKRLNTGVTIHESQDSIQTASDLYRIGVRIDSVFVDGCHEYAECFADIAAWVPLVRNGGMICGHDYWAADPGVMDAVNEYFKEGFSVVPDTRIWFVRI